MTLALVALALDTCYTGSGHQLQISITLDYVDSIPPGNCKTACEEGMWHCRLQAADISELVVAVVGKLSGDLHAPTKLAAANLPLTELDDGFYVALQAARS